MAKNSIRDFDATSGNNTDIQSIDISEGCAASGINNAIREVMADLKDVSTGAVNLETPVADGLTIGTSNLDMNGNELILDADADTSITADTDDQIDFKVGGSDKVTIDSTGVGIGNSSPSHLVDAIVSSGSATARFGTTHNSGANDGTVIISNGGTGDAMLRFDYEGTNTDRARIGVTSSGQQLEFYTAGDNERMTIESGGDVKIGSHYEFRSNGDFVLPASGFSQSANSKQLAAAILYSSRDSTASSAHLAFYNSNGEVGTIRTSGSATAYNTNSDYRLKENVTGMTGAIARVKQLAPKRFNFIADDGVTVDGFLAHEAQTVVPEAVHGTHNEVDDDGNAVMQGIDQSKLVPLLTGALQEAIAKIETLETEMTALKARVTALEA